MNFVQRFGVLLRQRGKSWGNYLPSDFFLVNDNQVFCGYIINLEKSPYKVKSFSIRYPPILFSLR